MSVFLDLNKIYKGKLFSDTNQVKKVLYDTTEIPLDVDPVIYSGALTTIVTYSSIIFDVFSAFSITLKDQYGVFLTYGNVLTPGFTFVPRPGGGSPIEILVSDDTIQILGAYTDYISGTAKQPPVVLYDGTFMEEINTGVSFSTYPQIKVTVVGQPYGGDYFSYTHTFTSTGFYYRGLEPVLEAFSYGGTIWLLNYGDNFSEGTIKVEGLS